MTSDLDRLLQIQRTRDYYDDGDIDKEEYQLLKEKIEKVIEKAEKPNFIKTGTIISENVLDRRELLELVDELKQNQRTEQDKQNEKIVERLKTRLRENDTSIPTLQVRDPDIENLRWIIFRELQSILGDKK